MTIRTASLLGLMAVPGFAQLTLEDAVNQAVARYPAVKAAVEQAASAAAGVNLARTGYLPRADFIGQVNRSTHNNVFGLLLPQSVISSITGPVLGTNSLNSIWESGTGVLVSWEPFDFGLRKANVEAAGAALERVQAQVEVTRLQVGAAAADAFLAIQAAQQSIAAARAGVERAQTLLKVVSTLVASELRPGAEESRSRAELARARTLLIQAEQSEAVAEAALAQILGSPAGAMHKTPGKLLGRAPGPGAEEYTAAKHPLAIAQQRSIDEVKARETALDKTYVPRLNLQANVFARGTGIQADGRTGGTASGLGPNVQNWALGFTVTFPAFDLPAIRARKDAEVHRELSETARYQQVVQDIDGQVAQARAQLEGARRIAENTPLQLEAARATERQAKARYEAGLGNIVEVAEAERLLTQTEIDDSLARLAVWRALLGVAAAQGDLTPFLAMTE